MSHPYRESYLQEIVETQGQLFERLQDDAPQADGMDFIRTYMKSGTRAFLDKGDAYLATLGPALLLEYYRTEEPYELVAGSPVRGFSPNWMGQFYARYQWQTDSSSREIVDAIPPEWLNAAYPGLHDLDLGMAVEKVEEQLRQQAPANLI